jgi:dihydrofolate reductase
MSIIGIVAIDRNLAIGKGGKLPWHYSADMRFFKETTIGNAVVMGRRTWMTLKGPLPNRQNIVLSQTGSITSSHDVTILKDVDAVLKFAKPLDHLTLIHS